MFIDIHRRAPDMSSHDMCSVQGGKRIDLEKDGPLNVDSFLLAWKLVSMQLSGPGPTHSPEHLSCLLVIIVLTVLQIVDTDKRASESGLSAIRNLSAQELTCDYIYR